MSVEAFRKSSSAKDSGRGGTPSHRRLSGRMALTPLGSNAVANNDRAEKMSRRRREARRRSGRFTPVAMGNAPGGRAQHIAAAEDLSSHVTDTIKLHVENKISEKNAFSLPLNSMLQSTNTKFQRAGMILEAGAMIYGKRVDSTMVDSLKVRESLMRTKSAQVDNANRQQKGAIRTNVSKKVCVTSTIEKNLENITEKRRNQAFAVDPLFRQMSQKFDNGGAQGMLLTSLPVKKGCFVAFDSAQPLFAADGAATDAPTEEPVGDDAEEAAAGGSSRPSGVLLPRSVLATFQQAAARSQALPMCAALLDILYNEAAAEEPFRQAGNAPTVASTAAAEAEAQQHLQEFDEPAVWESNDDGGAGDGYDDDGDCGGGDDDDYYAPDGGGDDEFFQQLASAPSSQDGGAGATSATAFDFWSGDSGSGGGAWGGAGRITVDVEVAIRESGRSDYTFFDAKFNRRAAGSRAAGKGANNGKGEDGRAKRSREKKAKFYFDFAAAVDKAANTSEEDIVYVFAPPTKPSKMLLPANRASKADDYVLPEQPHLKLDEMTKLFLNSKLSLACKIVAKSDTVLGGDNNNFDDYGDDSGFDGGDDYGDDGDGGGIVDDREGFEARPTGNAGDTRLSCMDGYGDLIDAEPQVENIELAYARVAKRVDVRMVKQSLWKQVEPLQQQHEVAEEGEKEKEAPADDSSNSGKNEDANALSNDGAAASEQPEALSFKDTMLAVKQTVPDNVSVSYFFICMLHLANEKNLEFTGSDDLEDFQITK